MLETARSFLFGCFLCVFLYVFRNHKKQHGKMWLLKWGNPSPKVFLHEEKTLCFWPENTRRSGLFPESTRQTEGASNYTNPSKHQWQVSSSKFSSHVFLSPATVFLSICLINTTFEIETTAEKKTKVTRVLWILHVAICHFKDVLTSMWCICLTVLKSSGAMMLNYWNNMSTKTYQHWHPMPFWIYPSKHQYWYTSKNISNIRFICRKSSIIYQSFMRNNGATPDCWALNFQAAKRFKKKWLF